MGEHFIDGEFQSDKYPTTPPGKVPLSTKDPTAQDLLWEYARRHRTVDAEFSRDLEMALLAKGFEPPKETPEGLHSDPVAKADLPKGTGIDPEDFDKRSLSVGVRLTGYEGVWAKREIGLCVMCNTALEERSYATPESNPRIGPGSTTPEHWKFHYAICPKCGILYDTVLIPPSRQEER